MNDKRKDQTGRQETGEDTSQRIQARNSRLCVCGGSLKETHVDDAKVAWFKCEKCGIVVSELGVSDVKRKEFYERLRNYKRPEKEDKPKVRNRCGECAAFHTPFCMWEYKDMKTPEAYKVHAEDYACTLYFPRLNVPRKQSANFEKRVENL